MKKFMQNLWAAIFKIVVLVLSFGSLGHRGRWISSDQYLGALCLLLFNAITGFNIYLVVNYFSSGSYVPIMASILPSLLAVFLIARWIGKKMRSFYDNFGEDVSLVSIIFAFFFILLFLFGIYLVLAELTSFFTWCAWFLSNYWTWILSLIPLYFLIRFRFYLYVFLVPIRSLKKVARILKKIEKTKNWCRLDFFYWKLSKSNNLLLLSVIMSDLILNKYHNHIGRDYPLFKRLAVLLMRNPKSHTLVRPIFISEDAYSRYAVQYIYDLLTFMKEGGTTRKMEVALLLQSFLSFLGSPKNPGDLDVLSGFWPYREFINHPVFLEYGARRKQMARENEEKTRLMAVIDKEMVEKVSVEMENGDILSFLILYKKIGPNLLKNHKASVHRFFDGIQNETLPKALFHFSQEKRQAIWSSELDLFFAACADIYRQSYEDQLLQNIKAICLKFLANIQSVASKSVNPASIARLCENKRAELGF